MSSRSSLLLSYRDLWPLCLCLPACFLIISLQNFSLWLVGLSPMITGHRYSSHSRHTGGFSILLSTRKCLRRLKVRLLSPHPLTLSLWLTLVLILTGRASIFTVTTTTTSSLPYPCQFLDYYEMCQLLLIIITLWPTAVMLHAPVCPTHQRCHNSLDLWLLPLYLSSSFALWVKAWIRFYGLDVIIWTCISICISAAASAAAAEYDAFSAHPWEVRTCITFNSSTNSFISRLIFQLSKVFTTFCF